MPDDDLVLQFIGWVLIGAFLFVVGTLVIDHIMYERKRRAMVGIRKDYGKGDNAD